MPTQNTPPAVASVRFTLSIWITIDVQEGDDPRDYITTGEQHRIERDVLRAIKYGNVDGECMDVELLDAAGAVVTDADLNPRSKGDDDGVEYADPRDARDERRS